MTHLKKFSALFLLSLVFFAPLFTLAQNDGSTAAPYDFRNDGIFGCNQIAGANASAGAMAAIGGIYVPVNDAAVTLNTGILVYKECVLRPLQDRLREAATAALVQKQTVNILNGRNGAPRYSVNPQQEDVEAADKATVVFLTDPTLQKMNAALREEVKRALATNYRDETRKQSDLECAYQGDLKADITNPTSRPFDPENFRKLSNPACTPYFAYMQAKERRDEKIAATIAYQRDQRLMGRGFYPVTDLADDPLQEKILTPASVVQESYQQILGSPVRQLESANDIGQMVGALFSSLTTQIVTDSKGLSGLTQKTNGRPSYLEQLTRESSQGVIGAAVTAALTVLQAYQNFEARYFDAMTAIAARLTRAINTFRSVEDQCFALLVPRVRDYAASNGMELDNAKIRSATSSRMFSQPVIDSQITPLATAALANIEASTKAKDLVQGLIAGVQNTASVGAQRLALEQLDRLVSGGKLHTKADAENAERQRDDISSAMTGLENDTKVAWADSPDPGTGWCNYNNQNVLQMWATRWKK